MISWDEVKDFWDYIEYYPESDEEGYDGEHDGGIKGVRDDAPEEAKKAYRKYLAKNKEGVKI